jgi:serine/threonine protein kinase
MSSSVESDPTGRYHRVRHSKNFIILFQHLYSQQSSDRLGEGSFKIVYKAFDSEEGKDVAWNQVRISGGSKETKEEKLQKVLEEVETLQRVKHKHIIECFHSWVDNEKEQVNFITEMMSGSLKRCKSNKIYFLCIFIIIQNLKSTFGSFVLNKKVNVKASRNWSRQILQALHYLHSQGDKPIIHRDLKCDNIFINNHNGEVKLGDLGLSTTMVETHAQSVIGMSNRPVSLSYPLVPYSSVISLMQGPLNLWLPSCSTRNTPKRSDQNITTCMVAVHAI